MDSGILIFAFAARGSDKVHSEPAETSSASLLPGRVREVIGQVQRSL